MSWAGFSGWQHPTLVAWGLKDPWLPLSLAQSFMAALKEGELAQLEEVGHYPQEDWHEKVSDRSFPFSVAQLKSWIGGFPVKGFPPTCDDRNV
ncbi:MAG: hypothetical protein HC781_22415 [Leptolyngbyaceae cyanobacterium CSU_1_4]|nr:hypothetical protein [Leptolyngbyaceae cyanobacterium CSU_1_4]